VKKAALHLLALVFGITVLAAAGYCNSAMFTSMAANPVNPNQPLSASALFSLTGNQLTIQVNNNSAPETQRYVDSDVLTGIYFSTEPLNLTPQSATAPQLVNAAGTTVCAASCDTRDGWAYQSLTLPEFGLFNGISAVQSPVYIFSNFIEAGKPLGRTNYGIVPGTYPDAGGTNLDTGPYSLGSATFVLNVPNSFMLTTIDRVVFTWGTAADQPWGAGYYDTSYDILGNPEPSTWILTATAAAGLLARKTSQARARRRSM